ncbi:MAG: hypothetical protein K1X53_16485 [Candidatus Sumerlaeaceae bacterium]|nr:hypothetical protein [Candidatus Sumerlaeaceae bacterium]
MWPKSLGLSTLFILCAAVVPAEDIVIEARPEGKNFDHYAEPAGNWMNSGGAPPGHGKSRAPGLSDPNKVGTRKILLGPKANGEARFMPKLTKPEKLFVYVTWPREGNASSVTYVVKHAGGEEVKKMPQDGWGSSGASNAGVWNELGQFTFNAGDDQYVAVRIGPDAAALDTRNIPQAYADAARFSSEKLTDVGSSPLPLAPKPGTAAAKTTSVGGLEWHDSIAGARSAAGSSKKILLFFSAPGATASELYENTLLKDPAVVAVLSGGFACAKLNFVQNVETAYKLQVFKAGTIMIYDAQGGFLKKIDGPRTAADLAAELKKL